jgi:alginate O-acetyltransferase complex protein AlgI
MLFNSFRFLIFFPVVVAAYFAIPHKYRWILLLLASYYFYMCWKAEYLILIIISTLIDYFAGLQMGKIPEKEKRKPFLILSLCMNFGLLFSFKYFNFFNESFIILFRYLNIIYHVPSLKVLLPVGISFYTFQTLSYTIDVYRGNREPERHLGIFALYVAFFPQLVAGPIERSTRLLPQFYEKMEFDYQRVKDGLLLMTWGFFKKVVIADWIAIYINQVYNNPAYYPGLPSIVATYFFAFQIYCDFSGYSDIAIGAARVMGYRLMLNFNRPYFAKSIAEFWKRWHISLTSWFRDYLYISLGGNRVVRWRWFTNIFIVFLLSGLWHGANWTFILWGALHGSYYLISIWTANFRLKFNKMLGLLHFPRIHQYLKVFITFHLVLFSWIFFRANSLQDAFLIVGNLFSSFDLNSLFTVTGFSQQHFVLAVISILVLIAVELFQRQHKIADWLRARPVLVRWLVYYSGVMIILLFGAYDNSRAFIYFQF